MKIVAIRGFHLGYDLPEPLRNSIQVFRRLEALLLRLETECGW